MSVPPGPAETTKEQLMNAAKVLFAEHGYAGTTVKQLADAAGVNVSLVSYHFNGKEGLYRVCLESFGKDRLAATQRIFANPATSQEEFKVRIKMFFEEFVQCHFDEPHLTKIIHREVLQQNEFIQDIFSKTFLITFRMMIGYVAAAQEKGFVKAGVDPLYVGALLQSSILGLVQNDWAGKKYFNRTIEDPKYRASTIEAILQVLFHGFIN